MVFVVSFATELPNNPQRYPTKLRACSGLAPALLTKDRCFAAADCEGQEKETSISANFPSREPASFKTSRGSHPYQPSVPQPTSEGRLFQFGALIFNKTSYKFWQQASR